MTALEAQRDAVEVEDEAQVWDWGVCVWVGVRGGVHQFVRTLQVFITQYLRCICRYTCIYV